MTEVALFTPLGLESRRAVVVRWLAEADYGELVPYADLEELLDVSRRVVQNVVGSAKARLEREHRKVAVAVARQGYRIALPGEHMALAGGHQLKSTRALKRALSTVENVDMSRLTEGERAAVTLGVTSLALQIDYQRRNDIRAARHEQLIAATTTVSERTAAEVAILKERLERLEGGAA